ncbi:hypothetical protein ACF0H5_000836 [Mactra antiquata]
MASILWNMLSLLAALFCMFVSKCNGDGVIQSLDFCSFFNNRSPSPQTNLRNCTWFMKNSCCKQEEIDATFGTVKPLPGSSPQCQRWLVQVVRVVEFVSNVTNVDICNARINHANTSALLLPVNVLDAGSPADRSLLKISKCLHYKKTDLTVVLISF